METVLYDSRIGWFSQINCLEPPDHYSYNKLHFRRVCLCHKIEVVLGFGRAAAVGPVSLCQPRKSQLHSPFGWFNRMLCWIALEDRLVLVFTAHHSHHSHNSHHSHLHHSRCVLSLCPVEIFWWCLRWIKGDAPCRRHGQTKSWVAGLFRCSNSFGDDVILYGYWDREVHSILCVSQCVARNFDSHTDKKVRRKERQWTKTRASRCISYCFFCLLIICQSATILGGFNSAMWMRFAHLNIARHVWLPHVVTRWN